MAITDADIVSNIHTEFEKSLAEQALNSEINTYTTAERDALSPAEPQLIFNSTSGTFEGWDGASWLALDNVPVQGNLTTHIADGEAHGISTFGSTLVGAVDAETARNTLEIDAGFTSFTTSTNLDLTSETGDCRVFADSSGGVLSVTLPSGTANQVVAIIDAGESAGGNIITIVGTIDGATNATIEADGATREFVYSGSAWESSGGFERFFTREAATGRISAREPDTIQVTQINAGASGSSYSGGTGDFTDPEANVDQNAAGWRNGSESRTLSSATASDSFSVSYDGTKAIDGNTSTYWQTSVGVAPRNETLAITISSAQIVDQFTIQAPSVSLEGMPTTVDLIEGWNGSAWVNVDTNQISLGGAWTAQELRTFTFTNTTAYDQYRFTLNHSGNGYITIGEMTLNLASATTANTFIHRVHTSGGSLTFSPSSLVLRDSGSVQLINGEVLVEYSTDNGSTWPGGQRSLTDFTALGTVSGTSFWLRFEIVGGKNIASSTIQTAASYASMANDGLDVVVDSSVVSKIKSTGILFPSFTTSERDALPGVDTGSTIYNSTTNKLNFYNGSAWEVVTSV